MNILSRLNYTEKSRLTCNCILYPSQHQKYLLSGTYQYQSDGNCIGSLDTYKISSSSDLTLTLETSLECAGIFDLIELKDDKILLICTDGTLREIQLNSCISPDNNIPPLISNEGIIYNVGNEILTSCSALSQNQWIGTEHKGGVFSFDPSTSLVTGTWQGHLYDSWCSASFSSNGDPSLFFTGGDDGKLNLWDLRLVGTENASTQSLPHNSNDCLTYKLPPDERRIEMPVSSSAFNAGVVCIEHVRNQKQSDSQCDASDVVTSEHLLLVGSYDEHVHLLDKRRMSCPISSIHVEGGSWRIRYPLKMDNLLLVASMQRGVCVVEFHPGLANPFKRKGWFHTPEDSRVLSNNETEVLIYDCAEIMTNLNSSLNVASCSFYQREISLWEIIFE